MVCRSPKGKQRKECTGLGIIVQVIVAGEFFVGVFVVVFVVVLWSLVGLLLFGVLFLFLFVLLIFCWFVVVVGLKKNIFILFY